ncbi:MAG: PCYCGC domain-containing protein [Chloroflexi bacterium]|nr:PCYCGC domain-containing protein [Chloroflexota bacterium]
MRRWIIIALAAAAVLASCSSTGASDPNFPAFVYSSSSSLEGYRIAVRMPEVLEKMPCYCGCGKTNNHHSLKECFIKPDGSYDDHASGCDVCVKEAVDVDNWHRQGKSLAEVRRLLDAKYRDYGQPTDTAPVE